MVVPVGCPPRRRFRANSALVWCCRMHCGGMIQRPPRKRLARLAVPIPPPLAPFPSPLLRRTSPPLPRVAPPARTPTPCRGSNDVSDAGKPFRLALSPVVVRTFVFAVVMPSVRSAAALWRSPVVVVVDVKGIVQRCFVPSSPLHRRTMLETMGSDVIGSAAARGKRRVERKTGDCSGSARLVFDQE